MGYRLGIDVGTTFTAAAIFRDGRVEIASLGNRAASVPSVLFLRDDGTFLVGDAADRRAVTEPERVAREFKRRIGDSTPIIIGGTPFAAEGLTAKLLRFVVDAVTEVEGEPPDHIGITHPANWGPYKTDLIEQATRMADLDHVTFLTEPEAAAIYYASNERVDVGTVVAVYDLGGGTFDAAVLQKTGTGFKILGTPEGIERLGGIDFDHAVLAHVNRALDGALDELDPTDENDIAALGRLKHDCIEAKEGLSTDTDVSIPVMLPKLQTQVRLTRGEFDAMVRPTLAETMHALGRALRAADVEPQAISKVLLVGGSSRIPLVGQMVSAELGRPVAVDAHPKYAIAHGAALAAEGFHREKTGMIPVIPQVAASAPMPAESPARVEAVVGAPGVEAAVQAPTGVADRGNGQHDVAAVTLQESPAVVVPPSPPAHVQEPPAPPPPPISPPRRRTIPRRYLVAAGGVVAALALFAVGFTFMRPAAEPQATPAATQASAPTEAESDNREFTPPAGVPFFAHIKSIDVQQGNYVVDFEVFGFEPKLEGANKHVHFFFDKVPPSQAGAPGSGPWQLYPTQAGVVGESPFTLLGVDDVIAGSSQICALVANSDHSVNPETGDCVALP